MMRVEYRIDELVLVGFDPRDRHRVGDAVERELGRPEGPMPRDHQHPPTRYASVERVQRAVAAAAREGRAR